MPRQRRWDLPGTWHHVMNRGVGHRSIFETRDDVRYFRSRLGKAVRRGDVEVHAWCALTTHFHLLLRSPAGRMHAAMQHIQREYSAWFNRRRDRDGPLYRSRYTSRSIDSLGYRRTVVRYIDANAANAMISPNPLRYAHGSAIAHSSGCGQPWLTRDWIRSESLRITGATEFEPALYERAFSPLLSPEAREWVEARIRSNSEEPDELDDLLGAAPEGFLDWLWRKTECADATRPGLPLASIDGVRCVLAAVRTQHERLAAMSTARWRLLEVGLLRDVAAASYAEIGARVGTTAQAACATHVRHAHALRVDSEYALHAGIAARHVLRTLHGREIEPVTSAGRALVDGSN